MDEENVSRRLVDQRLRNRIMESLDWLAEGNEGITDFGAGEWFNQFFDWYDEVWGQPFSNSAMTRGEIEAFLVIYRMMRDASDATPKQTSDSDPIASGWPQRIAPVARAALDLMANRGRFSEEIEQQEPS